MKIKIADPANEGQFIEVDVSPEQLAEAGMVSPEQFTTRFQAELKRRTAAELQTKMADHTTTLLADDAFRTQAIEAWGIKPDAKPDPNVAAQEFAQRLEAARADWTTKELQPFIDKLAKADERVGGVMKKLLHGSIMQAAVEAGIKPELLKPGPGGSVAPLLAMLEPMFGYSEEYDGFFTKDGESSYKFSAKPDGGAPYMGVEELLGGWATDKDNAWAVDAQRQVGPNAGDPKGAAQRGGVIRLTADEASDHGVYAAAQKQAAEAGGRVEVEGMPVLGGTG